MTPRLVHTGLPLLAAASSLGCAFVESGSGPLASDPRPGPALARREDAAPRRAPLPAAAPLGVPEPRGPAPAPDPVDPGAACIDATCDDFDVCTFGDACVGGVCRGGALAPGCIVYHEDSFEGGSAGWTLTGEWQSGEPIDDPALAVPARRGARVLGTRLFGPHRLAEDARHPGGADSTATSGWIDLSTAVDPELSFYLLLDTETSPREGLRLSLAVDGGPFSLVGGGALCDLPHGCTSLPISRPYLATSTDRQPTWAGAERRLGWQRVLVHLSAFAGHQLRLRFTYRAGARPRGHGPRLAEPAPGLGVRLDDVVVGEASAIPLLVTAAGLGDAVAGHPYVAVVERSGGSASAAWSVVASANAGWLSIDPVGGTLSGAPTAADRGPAWVTVRVEEPTLLENFAERTFAFVVR